MQAAPPTPNAPFASEAKTEYQRLMLLATSIAHKTTPKRARTTSFTPFHGMLRVRDRVLMMRREIDENSHECMTAYLHCIFDRFVIGPRVLRERGVPGDVVDALKLLYWRKDQQTFVEHLHAVRENRIARIVKVAVLIEDLNSQLNSAKRIRNLAKGIDFLMEGMDRFE